ncbi:hypothetical protein COCON_G00192950 [Conger conger]|uniref:Uncharacterized protein n=1 Tax=Conger conger TaxID=82655 RepID=A0A9Q1D4M7_CONCO|nr:hypothetical protein COCON_G00192950 [Conger conger]
MVALATALRSQDDLHHVLGGHLAVAGEALVGPGVALGHALHHQALAAGARDAHVAAGPEDLAVTVPGQLKLLRAAHAAGQRHLATHAALHLPRTHHHLQGLCKTQRTPFSNRLRSFTALFYHAIRSTTWSLLQKQSNRFRGYKSLT